MQNEVHLLEESTVLELISACSCLPLGRNTDSVLSHGVWQFKALASPPVFREGAMTYQSRLISASTLAFLV